MTLTVERRQVLAYRVAAQGLHRDRATPGDLAVLDLGVQETTVRTCSSPDRTRLAAVWRNVSSPGAVLAGGEVTGVWRARKAGANRLDITVQPFTTLRAHTRRAIATEAERVAAARAAGDVRVAYEEAT